MTPRPSMDRPAVIFRAFFLPPWPLLHRAPLLERERITLAEQWCLAPQMLRNSALRSTLILLSYSCSAPAPHSPAPHLFGGHYGIVRSQVRSQAIFGNIRQYPPNILANLMRTPAGPDGSRPQENGSIAALYDRSGQWSPSTANNSQLDRPPLAVLAVLADWKPWSASRSRVAGPPPVSTAQTGRQPFAAPPAELPDLRRRLADAEVVWPDLAKSAEAESASAPCPPFPLSWRPFSQSTHTHTH